MDALEGGITLVTIDRPPANALDPSMLRRSLEILEQLMAEPPEAVVITGSGRFFSSGADLRVVPDLPADELADLTRAINYVFSMWYELPCPMVAAVNGHAVAGGLVIALCADHRVVGRSGKFGLTEVKVGIPFPSVAMAVVQNELTAPVVRRLVFGTQLFDAATAVELDLFDEIVDDEHVLDRSFEVAHELAALPRSTYAMVKRRLRSGAIQRTRGSFGGAEEAAGATAEAREAARKVLDRSTE